MRDKVRRWGDKIHIEVESESQTARARKGERERETERVYKEMRVKDRTERDRESE